MASVHQSASMKLNHGFLSPFREGLLEIQVNKLINEFLFSNGEDQKTIATLGSINTTFDSKMYIAVTKSQKPVAALEDKVNNSSFQNVPANCKELPEKNKGAVKEPDMKGDKATFISDNKEGSKVHSGPQLNRMETFPCKSNHEKVHDSAGDREREVKHNSRKPPRPPKPASTSAKNLSRCSSDTSVILKRSRRSKLERRQKSASGSSSRSSLLALIFTVCFAIVMILEGFGFSVNTVTAVSTRNTTFNDQYMKHILDDFKGFEGAGGRYGAQYEYNPRRERKLLARPLLRSKNL